MRRLAERYICIVDGISDRVRFLSFLLIVMTFISMYEVISRFVFNSPTIWAWEINHQLLCFVMIMAGCNTLLHKQHVAMDMFSSRWSTKTKTYVDLFTSFLPLLFLGCLLVVSADLALYSLVRRAAAPGLLEPPIYPLKVAIVVGIFLHLIQVVAEVMRNLLILRGTSNAA